MKTIFRRIFAAVLSLGVLASAGDLRVSAAGDNCDGNHSGASTWDESTIMADGGKYYLDKDVTLTTGEIVITNNVNVTICLNGKTITAADEHRIFNIQNGGALTLCNCIGNGTIAGGDVKNYGGDGGSSGGAVYVASGGKFILMNGNITSSSAIKGGGVYVDSGGEFTMHGGNISKNKSIIDTTATKDDNKGGDGGGVYVHKGGTFTMSDGTIFNNESEHQGGGVYVCGDDNVNNIGKFTMSGGVIKENKSAEGGGVYTAGTFTMSGSNSEIFGNTATSTYGGGVCVSGGNAKFTMESGTLSGNKAEKNGGGVYVSDSGAVEINGGTIGGKNEAAENGGGVYLAAGTGEITMNGGKISDNKSKNGGGIYVNGATFTMNGDSVISDNSATQDGGGVYLNNGNFTMTGNTKIEKNTATRYGGCVFVGKKDGGGTMTLNGTVTLTSNPKSDGKKSNVYLADTKTITIGNNFAITAIIGVHPELPPEDCVHYVPVTMFAGGVNPGDISEKFSPDREKQYILYEGGQVKLNGEHEFKADTWTITSETHSNECTRDGCGYGLITELHNFDGGKITKQPTYTQEGIKIYTCMDCGYEKEERIPLSPYDNDDDDDYYYDNDDPNSQTASPYNPQMGIAVSIAPTILAALGVAVVIYRKQNK